MISIIIPTYNEEEHIGECLDSILNQDYKDHEIIVVDGGSKDRTRYLVRKYPVKLLNNPKKITPCGLNIGIREAKGKYIVLLSGHSTVSKDFLTKNLETFKKVKAICVGGQHEAKYENNFSKLIGIVLHSRFSGGRSFYKRKEGFVDTVGFGMYDAKTLKKNLIDETFIIGNDNELNFRLINQGYKLYYNPEIKSYYYSRSSPIKFVRQMFNYGVAKARMIKKDRRNFRSSFLIPSLFIIYLFSLSSYNPFFYKLPMIFFILTNLFFSIRETRRYKVMWSIPILFSLFFMLYIYLGLGFIKGVIKC